MIQYLPDKT